MARRGSPKTRGSGGGGGGGGSGGRGGNDHDSPLSGVRFLRGVRLERERVPSFEQYPFSIPAVRALDELPFDPKVTCLVGENGSGKSTLLEAIAVSAGFNPEGGSKSFRFTTRSSES